ALHVADNRAETIAANVDPDFISSMIYVPFANRRFGASLPNQSPQRIVLPTVQDGKYNVDLADIDGQNRLSMVQGADQIHEPGFAFFGTSNHFWALDGQTVI